uniref:GDSL-type esterase/lipase family protein n=1 Tax=Oceanicella sp. SM1341 TaxID=1548889 RepID=UPI0018E5A59F
DGQPVDQAPFIAGLNAIRAGIQAVNAEAVAARTTANAAAPQAALDGESAARSAGDDALQAGLDMAQGDIAAAGVRITATEEGIAAERAAREAVLQARENTGEILPVLAAGNKVFGYFEADGFTMPVISESFREGITSAIASRATVDAAFVPLARAGDRVPLWLENGLLGGPGLSPLMRRSAVQDVAGEVAANATVGTPLTRAGGRVITWLDADGRYVWPGKELDLAQGGGGGDGLTEAQARALFAPRISAGLVPLATDGRTLYRWRGQLARIADGQAVQAGFGMTGDSWTELKEIPEAYWQMFGESRYGRSAAGFIKVTGGHHVGGHARSASAGWTEVDATATTTFPYGSGPDGLNIWTDRDGETLSYTNLACTEFRFLYFEYGGTWRYRIDGGAWSEVVCPDTGALNTILVSGLSDTVHTIDIDTAGNAGVVSLSGFIATRAGAPGIVLNKFGNSGVTGFGIGKYHAQIHPQMRYAPLDLVQVILGTNDYRTSNSPVPVFLEAIGNVCAQLRAIDPDIGIVLTAPAKTNAVPVTPLSDYRDALYAFALANDCEFLNLHDQMGEWAQAHDQGVMLNDLHFSTAGGRAAGGILNRSFLGI